MSVVLPKPKSITTEEVVLSRADWERLVSAFGNGNIDEDEDDIAAVAAARAEDAKFAARLEAERGRSVETSIPLEVVKAELDGTHPIRAWRDYRGWTQADLSAQSGVARDLIAQIETRRKNGSIESLSRLARTLGVPMEALIEDESEEIGMGETR
jgi:ribosome-binding protein aMBF1 (putative translation factor)